MSLKIVSVGKAVPENVVTNHKLSEFLDTSNEWIISKTGIESRHISSGETLTQLAAGAAESALLKAGITPADVDLIICSTIRGDYLFPSLSCCVSEKLSLKCPAFDINAACSGFIYALDVADGYISSGKAENVLIVCAEMMSSLVDWNDRATCVLFGDGAAACVISSGNALKYLRLTASGNTQVLNCCAGTGNNPFKEGKENGFLEMLGQEVFKFAVSKVESETALAFQKLNITADDIDYFLLHQANKRIIDTARMRMNQPAEKFPVNIQNYGNISSASIPILLDEMIEQGKIQKGTTLLMSAFGAGLTTGTLVMEWE
ncbi:MAG: beta-ketoacyl-ACP synthase III [Acutalibacteraceae bacterium]|jgi:3-oxoacyl-[acyl-carrier-protein] synthase-3